MDALLDTRGVTYLLLTFVLKAAADCTFPQVEGNVVLTDEALLMNAFPDGSVATLECANGYVIESGTVSITCIQGSWSKTELICKKKDCGPPESQSNMSFDTSGGTLFGDRVKVICDKGYRIRGSSYKECFSTGWGRRAICEIVTCEKPAIVLNGRSLWDSQNEPKYGEVVNYICNEGYTLIGKFVIECGETGEYDSQPPECKETSSSTDSPATPTSHRDKTITNSAISPSPQGVTDKTTTGDTDITTAAIVLSVTTSSFKDKNGDAVDTNKNIGYTPVIVSVICVSLVACIIVAFVHKFLLRRKGKIILSEIKCTLRFSSYDTREDLKPELLQFPNL